MKRGLRRRCISGHSERSAVGILKHYLALTGDMADAAIQKLIDFDEAAEAKAVETDAETKG